ncbi:MAG TPA: PAS domain S-box protein [Burkholderiaceae bacterium]|nr:PAS domain S-box protein [Burkholderiaceae bacterium]
MQVPAQERRATAIAGMPLGQSEERFRLVVDAVEDYAIFTLDRDGIVTSWNTGAQKIKGYAPDEIIGLPFTVFYTQDAIDSGWPQEELRRTEAQGRFEDEGWRVRKDGTRFWANVIITALRDDEGRTYGFAKITRDLTERRAHEEALRRSEERFRLLVESVRDYAIITLDPEGLIQSWNSGARALLGYPAAEVIGRHFSVFYTAQAIADGMPKREVEVALKDGRYEDEGWRVRKDGTVFWANVVVTPMFNEAGSLRGFAKVTRDMSERRRLAELEQSTRRMSEFIAMLAHELRNPLAPIRNAISIMQLETLDSPPLRSARDIIDRQLSHLTRLVDDLLDVGRIVTGKIVLKRERVSFRDVVLRSAEGSRPLMESRRHRFAVDVPADPLSTIGDETRLVQVLQNLLNNAAKFTPDGGRIQLSAWREGPSLVAQVTDSGRGMSAEALGRVFDLFAQEETGDATGNSGLGIGLTLARTLVEIHGGTLTASSAGPGQGSSFTVRLPGAPGSEGEASSAEPGHEREGAFGHRTLVVDDNRDSADTMTAVLRLLGHDARAAYDGSQAVEVCKQFQPDVVLLDLNMPGINGFSVLQRLRELPSAHTVFIAAMTGYGQAGDRARTAAAGFDAHLTKPVDVDKLRQVLAQAEDKRVER